MVDIEVQVEILRKIKKLILDIIVWASSNVQLFIIMLKCSKLCSYAFLNFKKRNTSECKFLKSALNMDRKLPNFVEKIFIFHFRYKWWIFNGYLIHSYIQIKRGHNKKIIHCVPFCKRRGGHTHNVSTTLYLHLLTWVQ